MNFREFLEAGDLYYSGTTQPPFASIGNRGSGRSNKNLDLRGYRVYKPFIDKYPELRELSRKTSEIKRFVFKIFNDIGDSFDLSSEGGAKLKEKVSTLKLNNYDILSVANTGVNRSEYGDEINDLLAKQDSVYDYLSGSEDALHHGKQGNSILFYHYQVIEPILNRLSDLYYIDELRDFMRYNFTSYLDTSN